MLRVATVGDEADESDSTVTATVDAGAGYTVGSPNSAGVTVVDDDSASTPTLPPATPDLPHVRIAAVERRVTEGETATFTVTASPAPAADVDVSVTVTATDPAVSSGAYDLTIMADQNTATLEVTTVGDTIDESDGTVTARVNPGTGYTVARPSSALVTVADDDETVKPPDDGDPLPDDPPPGGKPTVSITRVSPPSQVTEGDYVDVTLTANPAPTEQISGIVTFTDSSPVIGSLDNTFTFAIGIATARPFYIPEVDGADVSRTLIISLAPPEDDSYEVSSETRTVTIIDGDDD